jgi:hypothetical protein
MDSFSGWSSRDGIEPSTPAFSEVQQAVFTIT